MEMTKMNQKIRDLLDEYNHQNSQYGVGQILATWNKNKTNLMSHLARHPQWDAENYRIVFSSDYTRNMDTSAIYRFGEWAKDTYLNKIVSEKKIDGMSVEEFGTIYQRISSIYMRVCRIREMADEIGMDASISFVYKGEDYAELNSLLTEMQKKSEKYDNMITIRGVRVTDEEKEAFEKLSTFFSIMEGTPSNVLTSELANELKDNMPDMDFPTGIRINKIIQRVCKKYGLDKIKNIQNVTYTDQNGIEHTREKDFGYNAKIAELGDKINPLVIRRYTIISVNPMDYLTMSFGHNWASCHTIDKANKRGVGSNHHQGCYCSGTLSYMLDESSLIFYTVDAAYNGREFEYEDKMQRCVFNINEDGTVMVQGRVYPDGRDGGDMSLASQFRAVMQKVIAECFEHNNYWTVKKGHDNVEEYCDSYGTHYRDYEYDDDCTVSLLKGDGIKHKYVKIGHDPICPECGYEHEEAETLCCDEHSNYKTCDNCGDRFWTTDSDAICCEDTDTWYCCERCANRCDVYYCENDEAWHYIDFCYRDSYDGYYYYGDPEITTYDGCDYCSVENARNDGYEEANDGEWYREDELEYDEERDEYFKPDGDSIEIDGKWFINAESAREAGYIEFDGEWYSEDEVETDPNTGEMFPRNYGDAIEFEGQWYINAESAIQAGYNEEEDVA